MGVSLSYWTTAAVEPAIQRRIEAETRALVREWWCEPILWCAWPGKPGLAGDTKLYFGGGFSTEDGEFVDVPAEDDLFLAARDARFIVDQLAAWSARDGLTWTVVCVEDLGVVARGAPDARVAEFLAEMASQGGATGTPADDARAAALLRRYAARL